MEGKISLQEVAWVDADMHAISNAKGFIKDVRKEIVNLSLRRRLFDEATKEYGFTSL